GDFGVGQAGAGERAPGGDGFQGGVAVDLARRHGSGTASGRKIMSIQYEHSRAISRDEFTGLLRRSTLAERRPVEDAPCIEAMLKHGNLLCTAWDGETLVGVARSVTDFEYCCYLSDLAVDRKSVV